MEHNWAFLAREDFFESSTLYRFPKPRDLDLFKYSGFPFDTENTRRKARELVNGI